MDCYNETIKVLDSIDFTPYFEYIRKGSNVWTFFDAVERDFNNTELTNNEILEGYIFNWLSESEMIEYFEKRYPEKFKVIEYIEYRFC